MTVRKETVMLLRRLRGPPMVKNDARHEFRNQCDASETHGCHLDVHEQ